MYALQDAGDLKGARQQMHDVLAIEVVPLYREIAEGELAKLARLA
jgi:DUSAM domain-containing protein